MDESGDTGMKLGNGSSALFTIALVVFQEDVHVNACKQSIQDLRKKLGMPPDGEESEFHSCEMGADYRKDFLVATADFPFQFYTATIDKQKLSGRFWDKKEYMYQRASVLALDQAKSNLLEAKLVFDATSSRQFDWKLLRFLKKHAGYYEGLPVIKETQRLASYKDDLIQLVDIVCGAFMGRHTEPDHYKLIRHRNGGGILFP